MSNLATGLQGFTNVEQFETTLPNSYNLLQSTFQGMSQQQIITKGTTIGLNSALTQSAAQIFGVAGVEATATGSTVGLSTAFKGLALSVKSAFVALATNPLTWVVAAIGGTIAAIHLYNKSIDDAVDNSKKKLEDTQSELSDVNRSLEENDKRIAELSSITAPSIIDKNDLVQLKEQNRELAIRQKHLENQEKEDKADLAKNAEKKYKRDFGNQTVSREEINKHKFKVENPLEYYDNYNFDQHNTLPKVNGTSEAFNEEADTIAALIAEYELYSEKKQDAIAAEDSTQTDIYNDNIQKTKEELREKRVELQELKDDMSTGDASSDSLSQLDAQIKAIDQTILTTAEQFDILYDTMGDTQQSRLKDILLGDSSTELAAEFSDLNEWMITNGVTLDELKNKFVEEGFISVDALSMSNFAVRTLTSSLETAIQTQDTLNQALNESSSGKGISYEHYTALESAGYEDAFEFTDNGINLNTLALEKLQKAQMNVTKADFINQLQEQQAQYEKNAREIEDYKKVTDLDDQRANQDGLNTLIAENESIKNNITTIQALATEYEGLTSAYQQWMDAQNGGEQGDMYDNITSGLDKAKELYSDGLVGTNEFRKMANLMTYDDLTGLSTEEVVAQYQKASSAMDLYFQNGRDGCVNFLEQLHSLNSEWASQDGDGKWFGNFGDNNTGEIAQTLGISVEAVEAILRKLNDYGFEVKLDNSSVEDTLALLDASKTHLQEFDSDFTVKLDYSEIEDAQEKSQAMQSEINRLQEYRNINFEAGSDDYVNMNHLISEIITQKQLLNEPTVMGVDVEQMDEGMAQAIADLQELQTLSNELELNQALGLDTTQTEEDLAHLTEKIMEKQGEGAKINAALGIDGSNTDEILTQIANLNPEIIAKLKTGELNSENFDEIINSLPVSEVVIPVKAGESDTTEYDKSKEKTQSDVLDIFCKVSQIDQTLLLTTLNKTYPVNVLLNPINSINTSGSPTKPKGTNNSSGKNPNVFNGEFPTKKKSGIVKRNGSPSLPRDERALINELGEEIIVRGDQWYTVNNGYPAFANLKRGDIIFNHQQSQSLLKNGYLNNSHGKLIGSAWVNGTFSAQGAAYASFTGPSLTHTPNYNKPKTNQSQSRPSKSSAEQHATEKVIDAKEKEATIIDHVETLIKRLANSFKDLKENLDNCTLIYTKQNKIVENLLSNGANRLTSLKKAQATYTNYAQNIDLAPAYKKQVQEGSLVIESISDENLKKKINDYKEWYEKSEEVKSTIVELNQELKELRLQKLDNIKDYFDNVKQYYDDLISINDATSNLAKAKGSSMNEGVYIDSIKQLSSQKYYLQTEKTKLQAEFDALMKNGSIAYESSEWYEWTSVLMSINEQLIKCDTEVYKLRTSIIETKWDRFDEGIKKLDTMKDRLSGLGDLIDDTMNFTVDASTLSGMGYAKIALLTQEMISSKQALASYTQEFQKLDQQLALQMISTSEYTKRVNELKKSQLDEAKTLKNVKDALLDIVKNGIKKETEAMQDYISAQKESLSRQKEADNYEKQVQKKTKAIQNIKAKIAAMSGDNSDANAAKVRKLKAELASLEEELQDTKNDRKDTLLKQSYDDFLEEYKKTQEKQLTLLDTNLDAQKSAIDKLLKETSGNSSAILEELKKLTQLYGISLDKNITNAWGNSSSANNTYQNAIKDVSSTNATTSSMANGSWQQTDKGWIRLDKKGNVIKNNWVKDKDDWYYINQNGIMSTNAWKKYKDDWYYTNANGKMATNQWVKWKDDKWYYLGNDGKMLSSQWTKDKNNKWYYLDKNGVMKTSSWISYKGKDYYVEANGAMASYAYVKSKGNDLYYWLDKDGVYQKKWDTKTPNLKKYRLAYESGTASAQRGLGRFDEAGPGTEFYIEGNGYFKEYKGGEMVFNQAMKNTLFDFAKNPLNYVVDTLKFTNATLPSMISSNKFMEVHMNYQVENLTKESLPDFINIVNQAKKDMKHEVKQELYRDMKYR